MSAPELLVCGSLTLDNVVRADGALLPRTAAGNVVYAALGAALWGNSVGLVSRAGADFPADFLAMLRACGLHLDGIARLDAPHGMNVAFAYCADGSRVRAFPAELVARIPAAERARFTDYTTLGPAHRYATWLAFAPDAGDVPSGWEGARGVHLAAMPVQRHLSLTEHLCRPGRHVQVDSPWYDERTPGHDFHTTLLGRVDLLLPSEADVFTWQPGAGDALAATWALARSVRRPIVLKRGEAGCVVVDPAAEQAWTVPACPVAAIDPTGAGDAFCGGVLAGLQGGASLLRAAAFGTVSASFAVEGVGLAGLLAAERDEAVRRLEQLERRMTFHHPSEPAAWQ